MMRPYVPGDPSRWTLIYRWITARLGATLLVVAGVGILVWTALRSPQPTPGEMALLALLASTFNIWGGAQFASIGKADAKHARSAVRRLYTVGRSMVVASDDLRAAMASEDQERAAQCVHVLISQVEAAQAHLIDAIGDWDDVHPEALREVMRRQAMAQRVQAIEAEHD
jgi:hypothetical protein